jgi:hypothetical protein
VIQDGTKAPGRFAATFSAWSYENQGLTLLKHSGVGFGLFQSGPAADLMLLLTSYAHCVQASTVS